MSDSLNLEELSLRYFESFYGQNEGDSVHSTIATAVKHAGDVFKQSLLVPIFKLRPYSVYSLQSEGFLGLQNFISEFESAQCKTRLRRG